MKTLIVAVALVGLAAFGCSRSTPPPVGEADRPGGQTKIEEPQSQREGPEVAKSTKSVTAAAQPAVSDQSITVSFASWEEIQQRVASALGKVVVIDLWSVW